jgi:hypothetical protein
MHPLLLVYLVVTDMDDFGWGSKEKQVNGGRKGIQTKAWEADKVLPKHAIS